jgi:transposase
MLSRSGCCRKAGRTCRHAAEAAKLRVRIEALERICARLRAEKKKLAAGKAAAERQIEGLRQEVARLTAELDAARRSGKRQAAPFSKGPPKPHPRRPGRKPGKRYGKKGHRQPPPPAKINEFHQAPLPERCPHCQGTVEPQEVQYQYQWELPLEPICRQFAIPIGRCTQCGARVQGRHRLQTSDALGAAAAQLGPRAQAAIAWLNKRLGLSHGKIVEVFTQLFGIPLTRGGSAQIVLRAGRRCQPTYAGICDSVAGSPWLAGDETGWKVGGFPAWLHVLVGKDATCYAIDPRRSVGVQARLVGADYSGTVIHDGYSSYNRRFCRATHQQCIRHLIHRLEKVLKTARGRAHDFPRQILELLNYSLGLRDEFRLGHLTDNDLADSYLGLLCYLDTLVRRRRTNPANRKLARHLQRHLREWFWFLLDPHVDATNYRAEQALRYGVVNRKVWGGNRTAPGSVAQAILMSVLETARRQGHNPLEFLQNILLDTPPPCRACA